MRDTKKDISSKSSLDVTYRKGATQHRPLSVTFRCTPTEEAMLAKLTEDGTQKSDVLRLALQRYFESIYGKGSAPFLLAKAESLLQAS